jgi:tetratricopeptide (TPR) repeat protein
VQASAERTLALARELGQPYLLVSSLYALLQIAMSRADWTWAVALAEAVGTLDVAQGDWLLPDDRRTALPTHAGIAGSQRRRYLSLIAECQIFLSLAKMALEEPHGALEAARAARAIAQENKDARTIARSAQPLTYALLTTGAYGEALQVAEQAVAQIRTWQEPLALFWNLDALGMAYRAVLQLDLARLAYEEMLHLVMEQGWQHDILQTRARLCGICVLAGDWTGAYTYAVQVAEGSPDGPVPLANPHFYCQTAALLHAGEFARAAEGVRQYGARIGTNRQYRLTYLRALGTLARGQEDVEGAIQVLEEARALAEEMGVPDELWQTMAELASAYRAQGNTDAARQLSTRAAAVVQALAGDLLDPALRASFLAAVRGVIAGS